MRSCKSAGVLVLGSVVLLACAGKGPGLEPFELDQSAPTNNSVSGAQAVGQQLPVGGDQRPQTGAQALPTQRGQGLEPSDVTLVQDNASDDDDDDDDFEPFPTRPPEEPRPEEPRPTPNTPAPTEPMPPPTSGSEECDRLCAPAVDKQCSGACFLRCPAWLKIDEKCSVAVTALASCVNNASEACAAAEDRCQKEATAELKSCSGLGQ